MEISPYLIKQLARHHIDVNETQLRQLQTYIELLQKWSRVYNLIADDKTKVIIDRHILDSLLVLPYIHGTRIIDIGSGAGFPGIPLAILLPDRYFVLLDSNGKKTRFLTQVKLTLGLTNVEVINQRVETYQGDFLFDVVISRAFANLSDMLQLSHHLCTPKGEFIALKGEDIENELGSIPPLFERKLAERLPFLDKSIQRKIVIVTSK